MSAFFRAVTQLYLLLLLCSLNFSYAFLLFQYLNSTPFFMAYYSEIPNTLDSLIHLWRMHFKAKLNTLKWLVHGVLILGI